MTDYARLIGVRDGKAIGYRETPDMPRVEGLVLVAEEISCTESLSPVTHARPAGQDKLQEARADAASVTSARLWPPSSGGRQARA